MNNAIKTRLALIRAGKIPEGYKKGKLGIVPKDWKEINFSELFTSTSEYTDDYIIPLILVAVKRFFKNN